MPLSGAYADGVAGYAATPVRGVLRTSIPSFIKVARRTLILCPSVLFFRRTTSGDPMSRAIPVALFLAEKTFQIPVKFLPPDIRIIGPWRSRRAALSPFAAL